MEVGGAGQPVIRRYWLADAIVHLHRLLIFLASPHLTPLSHLLATSYFSSSRY
jgi:hypothetical protein